MSTIKGQGESIKQAIKWISGELQENDDKKLSVLIQTASLTFDLSPKDEMFLNSFYRENKNV